MAFASMFIVTFLFVIVIVAVVMIIVGIIFLAVGAAAKGKPKNIGKKYPNVFIAVGISILILPAGLIIYIGINGMTGYVNENIVTYDNIVDKWKNTNPNDDTVRNDVMKAVLNSAENGDKEKLVKVFSDEIKNDPNLSSQIDEFIKNFPKGLSKAGFKYISGVNYGDHFPFTYETLLNGEYYLIICNCCTTNRDGSSKIGVSSFIIKNARAYVVNDDTSSDKHIACIINNDSSIGICRINGNFRIFNKIDRTITEEEVIKTFESMKNVKTIDEFKSLYGEPNSSYEESYFYCFAYELAPKNGEPLYVIISQVEDGTISNAHIVDAEGTYSVWIDKNGNVQTESST